MKETRVTYIKTPIASVLIILAVLCGCFFESKVPLAPVDDRLFDEDLVGVWLQTDPLSSESPLKLTVAQFRGPEYFIESIYENFTSSSKEKPTRYAGYLTMVDKTMFMNVQELKKGIRKYAFFRVKKIGRDTLVVTSLKENIAPEFEDSKELYDFVKGHLAVDTAFTSVGTFERLE